MTWLFVAYIQGVKGHQALPAPNPDLIAEHCFPGKPDRCEVNLTEDEIYW
jgi:hypothetical protein